jgi:hypothetical protein
LGRAVRVVELASIYNATTPIMTASWPRSFFRVERLSGSRWFGGRARHHRASLVVIGRGSSPASPAGLAGQLACLVATLCYGFTIRLPAEVHSASGRSRRRRSRSSRSASSAVVMLVLTVARARAGRARPGRFVGSLLGSACSAPASPTSGNINVLARVGSHQRLDGDVRHARRGRRARHRAARRAALVARARRRGRWLLRGGSCSRRCRLRPGDAAPRNPLRPAPDPQRLDTPTAPNHALRRTALDIGPEDGWVSLHK